MSGELTSPKRAFTLSWNSISLAVVAPLPTTLLSVLVFAIVSVSLAGVTVAVISAPAVTVNVSILLPATA